MMRAYEVRTYGCQMNVHDSERIAALLDRRPGDVLREVEVLAQQASSRSRPWGKTSTRTAAGFGDRAAFGKLLRAVGAVPGIERVRFTSPHPARLHRDVVTAMAETPMVCPSLHMPLQRAPTTCCEPCAAAIAASGSSRSCPGSATMPDAAITTDIIVGFPTETEADFAETLCVVEASRFSGTFTF